jgi:hypothetical protein
MFHVKQPSPIEVRFVCTGCGQHVRTYRWVSYRTLPPSLDARDLCQACKDIEDNPQVALDDTP